MKLRKKLSLGCTLALASIGMVGATAFAVVSCSNGNDKPQLDNSKNVYQPSELLKSKISKEDLDTINTQIYNNNALLNQNKFENSREGIKMSLYVKNQKLSTSLKGSDLIISISYDIIEKSEGANPQGENMKMEMQSKVKSIITYTLVKDGEGAEELYKRAWDNSAVMIKNIVNGKEQQLEEPFNEKNETLVSLADLQEEIKSLYNKGVNQVITHPNPFSPQP